jgi:CheY-like chemotaxis protein
MAKMILLVDDDRDLVESLSLILKTRGYAVAAASSAAEGLRAILRVRPDLIILDVMMETDTAGFEAADQIRSARPGSRYAEFRAVPIIILTAIGQVTHSRFSLDPADNFLPGVAEFLTKPVDIDALLAAADRLLT